MNDNQDDFYEEPTEDELTLIPAKKRNPWIGLLLFLLIVALIAVAAWRHYDIVDQFIYGRYTPTPYPTQPATATPTATITPTPTIPPTPTVTPLPASAYRVTDIPNFLPKIPGMAIDAVVLDDDISLTPEPPFSDIGWTTSNNLGVPIGDAEIDPFHATFNAGKVTWEMDRPLNPGIYEVFVLDTVLASAGPMTYVVADRGTPMTPLLGNPSITLKSSREDIPQRVNLWRSLGIYELPTLDNHLTVSTTWDNRDQNTIVAFDQVLIARYPDSTKAMIQSLPPGQLRMILDDSQATNDARDQVYESEKQRAWGDRYLTLLNPDHDTKVTWTSPEKLPVGKYEIFAWVPQVVNSGDVTYIAKVNDSPANEGVTLNQSQQPGNGWVSLGTYETPRTIEFNMTLSVDLVIPAKTPGEIAIDAIAFVKMP